MTLADPNIKSSVLFDTIEQNFSTLSEAEKKKQIKQVKGIFELNVKGASGEIGTWTIDLKKEGKVVKGKGPKPDVTITLDDKILGDLGEGKTTGQKAFMGGKLKVKGNIMLATKLDGIFKATKAKL